MTESDQLRALWFSMPQQEEIEAAQRACCGRVCTGCEAPAAYAWRKRTVDLAVLLEQAVQQELTARERAAVRLHWFRSMSVRETAKALALSPSTVGGTLCRAQQKIEHALQYVVQYQHDVTAPSLVPLAVRMAAAVAAARDWLPEAVGPRLLALRLREALPLAAVAQAVDLPEARLAALESGKAELRAAELLRLSAFYLVPMEWIMKGADEDESTIAG